MKIKNTLFVLMALAIFSCKHNTENKPQDTTNEDTHELDHQKESTHWTYEGETGPTHWAEIEKQSDCDGIKQSPINIIDIEVVNDNSLTPIQIFYADSIKIHDVTNNGHSIQYNFEKGDYIA